MKLAVGYVRADAKAGASETRDLQRNRIAYYAKAHGMKIVGYFMDEHNDAGMPFTMNGIIGVLDTAEDVHAVIVTDRARVQAKGWRISPERELAEMQKTLIVLDEEPDGQVEVPKGFDTVVVKPKRLTALPDPKASSVEVGNSALARRLLLGRIKGAQEGFHQSGPAPFGYRRDYKTRGIIVVPQEAEVVRHVFRLYLALRSMKKVVEHLDDAKIRTRRGKKWSRAGLSWILKNDTYIGRVHFGEVKTRGHHAHIISPIIFNKANRLIREQDKRRDRRRGTSGRENPAEQGRRDAQSPASDRDGHAREADGTQPDVLRNAGPSVREGQGSGEAQPNVGGDRAGDPIS